MTERGSYEVCVMLTVHKVVTVDSDGMDEAEAMAIEKARLTVEDIDAGCEPEVLWVVPVKYEGE
jgi:hypothetical protein